jgi:hypothetical protein
MKIAATCATWDRIPAQLMAEQCGAETLFLPIVNPSRELEGSLLVYHPALKRLALDLAALVNNKAMENG